MATLVSTTDATQLDTYKRCNEMYRLKYGLNLRRIEDMEDSYRMFWGIGVHAGLEQKYQKNPVSAQIQAMSEAFGLPDYEAYPLYTRANAEQLLKEYDQYAQKQDVGLEVISTEQVDTVELLPGIGYTVKIDMIVKLNGEFWWIDHKTTQSALTDWYWKRYEFDAKGTGYTWYVTNKFGSCSGGIINALRCHWYLKTTTRNKGKANEETIPRGFYWEPQRRRFTRSFEQVVAWKKDTTNWLDKLAEDIGRTGYEQRWLQNDGQCAGCQFNEYCLSGGNDQLLDILYEKHDAKAYLKDNTEEDNG